MTYRRGATVYQIVVENPNGLETGAAHVWLDGQEQSGNAVELVEDGKTHEVRVELRAQDK